MPVSSSLTPHVARTRKDSGNLAVDQNCVAVEDDQVQFALASSMPTAEHMPAAEQ
jgi:hypothetical protein